MNKCSLKVNSYHNYGKNSLEPILDTIAEAISNLNRR